MSGEKSSRLRTNRNHRARTHDATRYEHKRAKHINYVTYSEKTRKESAGEKKSSPEG
jgi:hypothetical protein